MIMKSFLFGLGLGLGIGILFAPMSGEETRGNIRQGASDLADSAREAVEQGRERMRSGISSIRNTAHGQRLRNGSEAPTGTESGGV